MFIPGLIVLVMTIVGMFLTDIPTSDNLTQFRGYITMR